MPARRGADGRFLPAPGRGDPRVRLYYDGLAQVLQSRQVRDALHAHAQTVAIRAEQIAASEGEEVHADVTEGHHRLHNRPYARVESRDADQEFGTLAVRRRRTLGRAADMPVQP